MSETNYLSNEKAAGWDLERLRVFLTVVELGSLTRAAVFLGRPQPAISRQISRLETECNGRLFNRTGRGMTLTNLGETVLPKIVAVLEQANSLTAEIEDQTHLPQGEVRIGALPSLYMILGVPLFLEIRKKFPGIRLQIYEGSSGQIEQWISSGYIDIGLPYRYGGSFSPQIDPLLEVSSYLVGAPGSPLTAKDTVTFAELDKCPLVLPGGPSNVRQALDQLAKKANVELNVVLQADSVQIQKAVASLGDVYTVLPAHAVRDEVNAGQLAISEIVEPDFHRTVVLATSQARTVSRATNQVARIIREIISHNRESWQTPKK